MLTATKKKLINEQRSLLKRRFFSNNSMMIGLIILSFLITICLVGPAITNYTPFEMDVEKRLDGPNSIYLLGTDNYGRDLLTRIIYGARVSMGVGFLVAFITSMLGVVMGLYASYYKTLDHILMRISDGLIAIPGILFAIALMAALGPRTENVVLALSIVFTPYVARVVRSAALVVKEQTYIEAMKAQGASSTRIIWRHIAPNVLSPLIVQATFIFADTIITEAGLSFLGAGVPTPNPSWGNILYDGKLVIFNAWWMTVFPGIMIIMAVIGLNLLGDGIRDIMDPHYKKIRFKKAFRLKLNRGEKND
ncbi:ABC transporter permease [Bacillus norwichensis]|uniref:ABC transporter permease n=1 Tax=Bacillus norwichensis TaxID=2762217 RepID=A0ABR8VLK5_9BACI|nr:ABC transporter permease [Bacillus norwichensis]MBD8005471.1 ABC transporter permease [Bacillus norwichensis]